MKHLYLYGRAQTWGIIKHFILSLTFEVHLPLTTWHFFSCHFTESNRLLCSVISSYGISALEHRIMLMAGIAYGFCHFSKIKYPWPGLTFQHTPPTWHGPDFTCNFPETVLRPAGPRFTPNSCFVLTPTLPIVPLDNLGKTQTIWDWKPRLYPTTVSKMPGGLCSVISRDGISALEHSAAWYYWQGLHISSIISQRYNILRRTLHAF